MKGWRMSDIVERLRAEATDNRRYEVSGTLATEAADEITRLTAEVRVRQTIVEEARDERDAALADVEKLRAALEPFAKAAYGFDSYNIRDFEEWFAYSGTGAITVGDLRRARAALSGDKE